MEGPGGHVLAVLQVKRDSGDTAARADRRAMGHATRSPRRHPGRRWETVGKQSGGRGRGRGVVSASIARRTGTCARAAGMPRRVPLPSAVTSPPDRHRAARIFQWHGWEAGGPALHARGLPAHTLLTTISERANSLAFLHANFDAAVLLTAVRVVRSVHLGVRRHRTRHAEAFG